MRVIVGRFFRKPYLNLFNRCFAEPSFIKSKLEGVDRIVRVVITEDGINKKAP